MGKRKKQFVNKNAAGTHSFRLVHRSQRDPLIADNEASPFVLLPVASPNKPDKAPLRAGLFTGALAAEVLRDDRFDDEDGEFDDPELQERRDAAQRKAALAAAGVFFDDDYDYEQHLRTRGAPGADVVEAKAEDMAEVLEAKGLSLDQVARQRDLPPDLFGAAAEDETDVGMLNLAAPMSGPRLDWDPDIVAALDDGLDLEDPDNVLDDDFVLEAEELVPMGADDGEGGGHGGFDEFLREGAEADDQDWGGDGYHDHVARKLHEMRLGGQGGGYNSDDDDLPTDDEVEGDEFDEEGRPVQSLRGIVPRMHDRMQELDMEETRSRFTEYSMTSSILPRSEHLQLHDARFEKLYEQYDEDEIGALDFDDAALTGSRDPAQFDAVFDRFLEDQDEEYRHKLSNPDASESDMLRERTRLAALRSLEPDAEEPELLMPVERKKEREFDCESILSTRSSAYNHPTLITEPPRRKIRINKKTGLPDAFRGRIEPVARVDEEEHEAAKEDKVDDVANVDEHDEDEYDDDDEDSAAQSTKQHARPKDETPEQRKQRKQALKQERRERRATKKATKVAFKAEISRQTQIQQNAKANAAVALRIA